MRAGPVVAVTGAGGPVGRALVRALLERAAAGGARSARAGLRPGRVIAIGEPAPEGAPGGGEPDSANQADVVQDLDRDLNRDRDLGGAQWCAADITSPEVVDALAGADVVLHVATPDDLAANLKLAAPDRRIRAVRAAQAVTTAAAAVGAGRLVAVTSAMVFGARPDNPVPLADDAPQRADPDDGVVGDLLEVERVLERTPRVHPGMALTVLRPAAVVGPGVDTSLTRHFEAPRLLILRGAATRWQFCHVDDLAAGVLTSLDADLEGWLTIGCEGSLAEDAVERLSGMRRLEVPAGLAFSTAERLHRVGVLPTPASELAYVAHPWVVGSARLRAAGWRPRHDNEECLRELLEVVAGRRTAAGRRVDRRDAAMGAAGAAVALVGTAAILRQARSRRSGRHRPTLDP